MGIVYHLQRTTATMFLPNAERSYAGPRAASKTDRGLPALFKATGTAGLGPLQTGVGPFTVRARASSQSRS